jgi:cytochrome c553|tara:strand:+ start:709 stop:1158 length:450 start_codon:yes stop_codon:yes gene_type:complete
MVSILGKKTIIFTGVFVVISAAYLLLPIISNSTDDDELSVIDNSAIVSIELPDELSKVAQIGKLAFQSNCLACHGENAVGQKGVAPPLIHKIYEPSHHGDESFQRAISVGVRAHHWKFGNMPAIEGLTRGDVKAIIAYVRELQAANGIF